MSFPWIQEDAFGDKDDTMPQSVQTIETILQESDGVALLTTNKMMEPEDLMRWLVSKERGSRLMVM